MMCFPFTLDSDNPNNVWMQEMSEEDREIDQQLARRQWMDLYQQLAGEAYVHTLSSTQDFQDLVYIANIGIVLTHLPKPVAVVSNFKSPPRKGEDEIGKREFESMRYPVRRPPAGISWEGEADLKHVVDNIYIGGYGIRTDPKVYDWFEKEFDMKVIKVRMTDQKLYHFDCNCFPLTAETVLLCTSIMEPAEIKAVEKVAEVVPVSLALAHAALTNSVRVGSFVITGSTLSGLKPTDDDWDDECKKVAFLERVLPKYSLDPIIVNLSEYEKSGAACSCCVCHLNRQSYAVPMV
jgi:N-dimethylarginine dimethylaminohydrolase